MHFKIYQMINSIIKIFLVSLLTTMLVIANLTTSLSQNKKELENQKNKAQEEINYTNKLLESTKSDKKDNIYKLIIIEKRIKNRQKLIEKINAEIEETNGRIEDYKRVVQYMEEDLNKLSESYANLIRLIWKNKNKQNSLMFVLSSKDFNQSYIRIKCLQEASKLRKRQLLAIKAIKKLLEENKQKLESENDFKENLLRQQLATRKDLQNEMSEKQKTIQSLQSKEKDLEKKLKEQQKQLAELNRQISKIIEEEQRKAAKTESGQIKLTPAETIVSTNFENNKGKLPWPVEKGIISLGFGKQQHPVLKNLTVDNNGIDILTTENSLARTIFEGEITKIFKLPGMHNCIMIKHGEFYTVYTHIETALVSVGEKVTIKQPIGTIFTDNSDNKTVIHFEIWKGTNKENPASWIAQ